MQANLQATPTLYFQGICSDALAFYRAALGAEVLYELPYRSNVDPKVLKPGMEDMILRAALRIGDSVMYLSDGHADSPLAFKGLSMTLQVRDPAEAERVVAALADGGKVLMPLRSSQRNAAFGTLADRFGVHWVVEAPHAV